MQKKSKQQSDIIIRPDGEVVVSFLWDDLSHLVGRKAPEKKESPFAVDAPEDFSSEEYRSCKLCPKACGFNRVEKVHPSCGDHQLRVANAGVSFGDEAPIRGERGSAALMLSGCPLRCPSCHNPEMVQTLGDAYSLQDFLSLAWSFSEAENLQILSPTVHLPKLREALIHLRRQNFPLPILFKSSGFESVEQLKKFEGLVDIYLPDFKFGSCSPWAKQAKAKDYFHHATLAVEEMIRQVGGFVRDSRGVGQRGVFVRHVLAPLPPPERQEILKYLKSLPEGVEVSILDNFQVLDAYSSTSQ